MLFQSDMGKQDAEQVRRTFWAEHGTASAEVRGFADDLFRVATDRVGEIDGLIEKHAEHWRMERMAASTGICCGLRLRSCWHTAIRRGPLSSMRR